MPKRTSRDSDHQRTSSPLLTIVPVIHLNGTSVTYDDVGSGYDVIVLIHGHPFDRSMWRPQLDSLAALGWRALAPDLRGYGDSRTVNGVTTLDVFARDVTALLDQLGIDQVVMLGLSMGGQIAMEFARTNAQRLRGLVLAATFARPDSDEVRSNRRATAERLLREGMSPYAEELLPKLIAPRVLTEQPHVATHLIEMMRRTSAAGAAAALLGRAERPPYQHVLAALDTPALIIVGSEDSYTTRDDADEMTRLLKRSRLVWMEGVGHMPNMERPAEFNAALSGFLATLSGSNQTSRSATASRR